MVSFFKKMNSATAELKKQGKWNRLELVEELGEFVRGCSWSNNKHRVGMVSMTLEGYDDAFIGASLGISESTVRYTRAQLSNRLWDLFGVDFFEHLVNDSDDMVICRAKLDWVKLVQNGDVLRDLFLPNIAIQLEKVYNNNKYEIKDCKEEIKFLLDYSNARIKERLNSLDTDKLAYIGSLLSGKNGAGDITEKEMSLYNLFKSGGKK